MRFAHTNIVAKEWKGGQVNNLLTLLPRLGIFDFIDRYECKIILGRKIHAQDSKIKGKGGNHSLSYNV